MRFAESFILGLGGIITIATSAQAGDLDPPPGPPAPTMKTLQQVEPRVPIGQGDVPFVISSSGSYYLTENLIALAGGLDCITINASNVTLDLRGFEIGPTEIAQFNRGIVINDIYENVLITNGSIRFCASRGISAGPNPSSGAEYISIIGIRLVDHIAEGAVLGDRSTIMRCSAIRCGEDGFDVGDECLIADSIAQGCLNGFLVDNNCTVRGCVAEGNTDDGIDVDSGTVVEACTARLNTDNGFELDDARAVGCASSSNTGSGFLLNRSTLIDSTGQFNTLHGVHAFDSFVHRCHALMNQDAGMLIQNECVVTESYARDNGPFAMFVPGIQVDGSRNRIQGNTMIGNDIGLLVQGAANFIVQNVFTGNSFEHSIVAGNSVGQILDVSGADITTSNPWRNFIY